MKLIDADAEIKKREQEIEKYEKRVRELFDMNEPDNIRVISRINQCKANISDIKKEISLLKILSTAYDLDKVVSDLEEIYEIEKGDCMVNIAFEMCIDTVKKGYFDEERWYGCAKQY